ncbi:MAG: cupredoxin domain-containing protein [Gammaproteobacteria bacterium]|nr:cupredoxin domain-containing protein [Gammaproteobacteria bacterium]
MDFVINLVALAIIGFIIWWFWLSKAKTIRAASNVMEIVVENGVYTPARIEIPINTPVILRFVRKDSGPCAEKVIFHELDINETLPLNKPRDIMINVDKAGEYTFTCEMQMYRGALVVNNN